MAEVTMSIEEYFQLMGQLGTGTDEAAAFAASVREERKAGTLKLKRRGKPDPRMSKALKQANKWGRTKSGKLRKGVTQRDIMRKAHKLRRKM